MRGAVRKARMKRRGWLQVDEPSTHALVDGFGGVRVRGWAWLREPVQSVDIKVNGGTVPAEIGLERWDVAARIDLAALHSGWVGWVSSEYLKPGENRVEVVASGHGVTRRQTQEFFWHNVQVEDTQYDQMDLSGERFDPRSRTANAVFVAHHARYRVAASLARGRRVLDAGCGYGYGSQAMLGAGAVSVDGIDLSGPVIERAERDYPGGARFIRGDLRELPYEDQAFDLIVCFEVIEHLVEHDQVLNEFRRVLAPGGILAISTPNADVYPTGNPWHLKELSSADFEQLLSARFANTATLTQQLHLASVLGTRETQRSADAGTPVIADVLKLVREAPGEEEFVVILASDAPLPEIVPVVAVGDARDELVDAAIESWMKRAVKAEATVTVLQQRLTKVHGSGLAAKPQIEAVAERPSAQNAKDELQRELELGGFWMYDWDFGDLGKVEIDPGLRLLHQTRLELIEQPVRELLSVVGPEATVLDLACCEGWFSHRMLEWGAGRVVGIDIRPESVRRARRIRDFLGIEPARMEFHEADIFALPEFGSFDFVLCFGLIYHLENPVGALRIARTLTKGLCAIETQLTEQRDPLLAGNGFGLDLMERSESFAAWFEEDQDGDPLASYGQVMSLIPNESALLTMAKVAGFASPRILEAGPQHSEVYRIKRRAVLLASGRNQKVIPGLS